MKQSLLIFGTIFSIGFLTQADIVKVETLTRGDKSVYLLYDTFVSTDNAQAQAVAIEEALKKTENIKFIVEQPEPLTKADKRFSNTLDQLIKPEDKNDIKDDHSYGVASLLDHSDPKKLFINHLRSWIKLSWHLSLDEYSLLEIITNLDFSNITEEQWQILITNASPESFFAQYQHWTNLFSKLKNIMKSKKSKYFIDALTYKVQHKQTELEDFIKNNQKFSKKLEEIKLYEAKCKIKFVYPEKPKSWSHEEATPSGQNNFIPTGIEDFAETEVLFYALDDTSAHKKVVLLAGKALCEDLKESLILEDFSLSNFTGECLLSFKKIFSSKKTLASSHFGSDPKKLNLILNNYLRKSLFRFTKENQIKGKDCTPYHKLNSHLANGPSPTILA
jgi:hypothetical protein